MRQTFSPGHAIVADHRHCLHCFSDRPTNQHFDMDSVSRGRLDHDTMAVTVLGTPQLVTGKVGSAILLDGRQDALDFGDRSNDCFGNLDLCPHGLLLSLWLRPENLQDKAYYLSSGNNGVSVSYRARKLQVSAFIMTALTVLFPPPTPTPHPHPHPATPLLFCLFVVVLFLFLFF